VNIVRGGIHAKNMNNNEGAGMKKIIIAAAVFLLIKGMCFADEREELGRCRVGYFDNVDLNNDGLFEVIKITDPCKVFTNVPDSEWGDDKGVVIKIVNEAGELIHREVFEQIFEIDDAHIIDGSSKGFKQIFISGLNKHTILWERYTFGFKDGKYQIIKDWNKNVR